MSGVVSIACHGLTNTQAPQMRRVVELIIATGRDQLWHTCVEGVRCGSDPTVMH
jgi:hypothetical protein